MKEIQTTSTERVKLHRSEAAKKKRSRWECSVTDAERAVLKQTLRELRKEGERL